MLRLTQERADAPKPAVREREIALRIRSDSAFYRGELASMLGKEPPMRDVEARAIGVADSVFLRLGGGLGADGGELELYGHLAGDSITGSWHQVVFGGGARGTFVLRRQ